MLLASEAKIIPSFIPSSFFRYDSIIKDPAAPLVKRTVIKPVPKYPNAIFSEKVYPKNTVYNIICDKYREKKYMMKNIQIPDVYPNLIFEALLIEIGITSKLIDLVKILHCPNV